MKNVLLTALLLMSQVAFSQGLKVISNEQVHLWGEGGASTSVLSPKGDYILVSGADMKGLKMYDFATKKMTTLTDEKGAGFDAQISTDGNTVVYRNTDYKGRLRYTTLKAVDVNTKETQELIKDTRDLQGVAVKRGTVLAVNNDKVVLKTVSGTVLKSAEVPAVASIKNGQLYVTKNGKMKQVSPQGTKVSYLWPSISPDGTKLLYTVGGGHAYVANLDGTNPVSLGVLRAPKWMGNEWVVGMLDRDNGEIIVSSEIIAVKATGKDRTILTDSSVVAMYPSASLDASKIVYSTNKGEIYLMNVEPTK